MGPLYDAVGLGMRAFSRSAFRVRYVGPESFRLKPGTLIAATHRKETDVPLIAPELYFRASLWKHRSERMHFAARDDMFLRGFFAGFPPEMSPRTRRLLFPLSVGRFLPRVEVHPISSASTARLFELLDASPETPVADVVPERLLGAAAGAGPCRVCALGGRAAGRIRRPPLGARLTGRRARGVLERPRHEGDRGLPGARGSHAGREVAPRLSRGQAVAGR